MAATKKSNKSPEKSVVSAKKTAAKKAPPASPNKKKCKAPSASTTIGTGTGSKTSDDLILEALANFRLKREDAPTKEKLISVTMIVKKTFLNRLPKLKEKGLITYDKSGVSLTEKGIAALGPLAEVPKSNEEVHERLMKDLKPKEQRFFKFLLDHEEAEYKAHLKEDVAKALGYESKKQKTFQNLIGAMKGKNIVEYPDSDHVKFVKDTCFPW